MSDNLATVDQVSLCRRIRAFWSPGLGVKGSGFWFRGLGFQGLGRVWGFGRISERQQRGPRKQTYQKGVQKKAPDRARLVPFGREAAKTQNLRTTHPEGVQTRGTWPFC